MWLGGMDFMVGVETTGITVSHHAESIFKGISSGGGWLDMSTRNGLQFAMNFERVTFPCHAPVWKRLLDRSTSVSSVVTLPCDLRLHDAPPASYLYSIQYHNVEYII